MPTHADLELLAAVEDDRARFNGRRVMSLTIYDEKTAVVSLERDIERRRVARSAITIIPATGGPGSGA